MNMIRWMADNKVAANILMIVLLVGGLVLSTTITQEVFPDIEPNIISISALYPGAAPDEVETGIILQIEEAIDGLDGIKEIISSAREGVGVVSAEILDGEDMQQILADIKSQVDRIRTFPQDMENPVISIATNRRQVLSFILYGDIPENSLTDLAETLRDELLATNQVTQISLSGVRNREIAIEVSEENLSRHGLTLERVAEIIRRSSLDVPGGVIKTEAGEILLRTKEKKYFEQAYAGIILLSQADGSVVHLGDIASIRDGFEESYERAYFDGKPAVIMEVFRVGNETPRSVSRAVHAFQERKQHDLPSTVRLAIWNDRSDVLNDRLNLLLKNSVYGLILIVLILGLFMRVRLALFVTLGIPVSFLGALFILSGLDVSINMITLFAFILCLGIVVDDAIVVGESIFKQRQMGLSGLNASVKGTAEVVQPVIFAVLTTVAAFVPMLFVAGRMGQIYRAIPLIVIPVLLMSLAESIFILPAHLNRGAATSKAPSTSTGIAGALVTLRVGFDRWLESFVNGIFSRSIDLSLKNRYITLSIGTVLIMVSFSTIPAGILRFNYFPTIESDEVKAQIVMPFGTPVEQTDQVRRLLQQKAEELIIEIDKMRSDGVSNLRNVYSVLGSQTSRMGMGSSSQEGGSPVAEVALLLLSSDDRSISTTEFAERWRKAVGEIPGVDSLRFRSELVRSASPIDIQIAHDNPAILEEVAGKLKQIIAEFPGTSEIEDNAVIGKREFQFKIRPEARSLGLTEMDLGRQVRAAYYGAEALRLQRGRSEMKILVRYPEQDRISPASLENMRLRTADGNEIAFYQAVEISEGRGYGQISRRDRKRVLNVASQVNREIADPERILANMRTNLFPQLVTEYPGLSFNLEGEEKERKESMQSLGKGFILALFVIGGMIAILFRSYLQPLIVMSAIPFGFFGAIVGHLMLDYDLTLLSIMGLVALSGVVVNASLIMIDYVNLLRRKGMDAHDAVIEGTKRRFRPILLTSLTTFLGVTPLILESSIQAKFLIPMAISLGFGVLLSTLTTLYIVPSLYLMFEDIRNFTFGPQAATVEQGEQGEQG